MLGIFHKAVAQAPPELHSPEATAGMPPKPGAVRRQPKNVDEIMRDFLPAHSGDQTFSATFSGKATLACVTLRDPGTAFHQRLFCSYDEVHCLFLGNLQNLSGLIRQYGLCSKSTNEALLVIEAYRTLRDRGPYPADQVVKDLSGTFAFVVYDSKAATVFAALSCDGGIPLYWGVAADGSVVICDDMEIVKGSCGKSYAPFPTGCMFHSEGGLRSFEHPMNRMKAMPRWTARGQCAAPASMLIPSPR